MSCRETGPLLDPYVDDELRPEDRLRVEGHLHRCPGCRRTLEGLRRLVREASRLPRGIAPGRDLFPAIRRQLGQRAVAERPASAPRVRWIAWAAAAIVVAIAGMAGLRLRDGSGPASAAPRAGGDVLAARGAGAEPVEQAVEEYVDAARLLQSAIDGRRDRLTPETLEVLERNLSIIDAAIDEVQAALEADPSSRGNALALRAMHEQKVGLLRRFSRLTS